MIISDDAKALEIIKALSNEYSRKIILAISSRSLPIEEISESQHIPVSTCYRRVRELESYGLVKPDQTIIQADGKKFVSYRSTFTKALISLESNGLKVDVEMSNRKQPDKLHNIWSAVRDSGK